MMRVFVSEEGFETQVITIRTCMRGGRRKILGHGKTE